MAKRAGTPSQKALDAVHAFRMSQAGNLKAIGLKLGISKQAISGWKVVPAEWVRQLSDITGIPPWRLRPDLYEVPSNAAADVTGPSLT